MSKFYLIVFSVIALSSKNVSALNCYSCLWNLGGEENCIDNPTKVKVDECPDYQKICLVQRQEDTLSGNLVSIYRGCTQYDYENGEKPGPDYNTFFQTCKTDLCNTGTGKGQGGGSGGSGLYTVAPKGVGAVLTSSLGFVVGAFLLAIAF